MTRITACRHHGERPVALPDVSAISCPHCGPGRCFMATLEMLMLGEQRGHDDDFCHGHYNGQPKGGTKITQLSENTITPEPWSLKLPLHLDVLRPIRAFGAAPPNSRSQGRYRDSRSIP